MKKLLIIGVIAAAVIIVCAFLFDVYRVEGNSMEPTLLDGDIVLVSCHADYCNGDIIVCSTDSIYLEEKYIIKRYNSEESNIGIYVEGDNGKVSLDSHDFGEIPKSAYRGRALVRITRTLGLSYLGGQNNE